MTYEEALVYLTPEVRAAIRAVPEAEQHEVLLKFYPTLDVESVVVLLTWHEVWGSEDDEFLKCVETVCKPTP
ncbi:MAG: hypothetical protein WC869_01295 [Phycisphaerae bacterium]|jgi:hypothetical protein